MNPAVFVVLAVVGYAIFRVVKASQEKRQHEEHLRQLRERSQRGSGTRVVKRPPDATRRPPQAGAVLGELRRYFERGQQQGAGHREGHAISDEEPLPSERRATPQAPKRVQPQRPVPKPTPPPIATPAARVRRVRRVKAVPKRAPKPVAELEEEVHGLDVLKHSAAEHVRHEPVVKPTRSLADIMSSNHSDLGKGVLFAEILGDPVAFRRRSPVPRYR